MEIVESMVKKIEIDDKTCEYEYMLTRGKIILNHTSGIISIQSYGIEVERKDFMGGKLINVERDGIKNISSDRYKVHNLMRILYDNVVSPINFIEIIGEYVDEYTADYDNAYSDISNC